MSKKILLAENSRITLLLHCRALSERTSHDLIVARTGQEAVDLAASEQPDLIIMNTSMSGKSGFEACAEIRSHVNSSAVPIILLSHQNEPGMMDDGFQSGCSDFIIAPISEQELVALVEDRLDA